MNTISTLRNRLPSVLALFLFALTFILTGCGGGGGGTGGGAAVTSDTLVVTPSAATVKSGATLTISVIGGKRPYQVYSNNQEIIPISGTYDTDKITVVPAAVIANTDVTITVMDATNRTFDTNKSKITVIPSTIFQTATVTGIDIKYDDTGKRTDTFGSKDELSAGGSGVVEVQTTAPNRSLRFEVVQGAFSFVNGVSVPQSTSKCSTTGLNCSITLSTDGLGKASTLIIADATTASQYATLKITDVATGDSIQKSFFIFGVFQVYITPSTITVPPTSLTTCSANKTYDVFIYNGNPPYSIRNLTPEVVTVSTTTVLASGGKFTVTSTGVCTAAAGVALQVADATGAVRTLTFINATMQGAGALTVPNLSTVRGNPVSAFITGGIPPFTIKANLNANIATATITDRTITATPIAVGTTTLVIADATGTTTTATITVAAAGAMTIDINNITLPVGYSGTIPLNIIGGTGPYQIFNSNAAVVTVPSSSTSATFNAVVANVAGAATITVVDSIGRTATTAITHN